MEKAGKKITVKKKRQCEACLEKKVCIHKDVSGEHYFCNNCYDTRMNEDDHGVKCIEGHKNGVASGGWIMMEESCDECGYTVCECEEEQPDV